MVPVKRFSRYLPVKNLTEEEMKKRREMGLCYYCDKVFQRGHTCKTKQLYMIQRENDEEEEPEIWHDTKPPPEEELTISACATAGSPSCNTIKLKGKVNHHSVTILVDSGSTHNFVDPCTVERIGGLIEAIPPFSVVVDDGNRVKGSSKCSNLQWEVQGVQFISDLKVLPLGGCDMV